MENYYAAYTKQIQDVTYFFVKKFTIYPDLKGVPPILESYGMHTNFDKACKIASISDPKIKQQLMDEMDKNTEIQQAKIIDLNNKDFISRSAIK